MSGGLMNLTNHPLSSWPSTQREAALSTWGSVLELAPDAMLVAVDADESGVVRQAMEMVDEVERRAAGAALVAGELRLTLALVALLQARGVHCVTTVSERHVREEPRADGSVHVVRTYRFAGFRDLPQLATLVG